MVSTPSKEAQRSAAFEATNTVLGAFLGAYLGLAVAREDDLTGWQLLGLASMLFFTTSFVFCVRLAHGKMGSDPKAAALWFFLALCCGVAAMQDALLLLEITPHILIMCFAIWWLFAVGIEGTALLLKHGNGMK